MQKYRMFEASTHQAIADIFRNPQPPTDVQPSMDRAWNVYSEAMLRAGGSTQAPYLYLASGESTDLKLKSPVVIVDIPGLRQFGNDLGSTNFAKAAQVTLHCIGRNRGESKDIGGYIAETLRAVRVFDYNNPLAGTQPASTLDTRPAVLGVLPNYYWPVIQIMQIDPFVLQGPLKISGAQKQQGMLTSAHVVTFRWISSF